MKKLLVIVGLTATGKTKLALALAKKFNGELISADSRQVYQGMDIVTGKDLGVVKKSKVLIWGLDLVKPDEEFSAAHFVSFARKAVKDIWQRGKLPIIIGGTGFWIKVLLKGVDLLQIPPNPEIRKRLENLTLKQLQARLKKVWPERWQKMNSSDRQNPRRLVRAIETSVFKDTVKKKVGLAKDCQVFKIGLKTDFKTLYKRINERVIKRIEAGAVEETKALVKKGFSWNLPSMSGIGYRELKPFLKEKVSLEQAIERWQFSEHAYARRQKTWFTKDKEITWFNVNETGLFKNIVKRVKSWYDDN